MPLWQLPPYHSFSLLYVSTTGWEVIELHSQKSLFHYI